MNVSLLFESNFHGFFIHCTVHNGPSTACSILVAFIHNSILTRFPIFGKSSNSNSNLLCKNREAKSTLVLDFTQHHPSPVRTTYKLETYRCAASDGDTNALVGLVDVELALQVNLEGFDTPAIIVVEVFHGAGAEPEETR